MQDCQPECLAATEVVVGNLGDNPPSLLARGASDEQRLLQLHLRSESIDICAAKRYLTYAAGFGSPSMKPLDLYTTAPECAMRLFTKTAKQAKMRMKEALQCCAYIELKICVCMCTSV